MIFEYGVKRKTFELEMEMKEEEKGERKERRIEIRRGLWPS